MYASDLRSDQDELKTELLAEIAGLQTSIDSIEAGQGTALSAIGSLETRVDETLAQLRFVDGVVITLVPISKPSLDAAVQYLVGAFEQWSSKAGQHAATMGGVVMKAPTFSASYPGGVAVRASDDDQAEVLKKAGFTKVPAQENIFYVDRP
jgi:hypothetical protein